MVKTQALTVRLDRSDNVVVALRELPAGTEIPDESIVSRDRIPSGHKIATSHIEAGKAIRKYNQIIGFSLRVIRPGEHVHLHNVEMKTFSRDHAIATDQRPTNYVPERDRQFFQGIIRKDGRVATRNYIGIISTVNCSVTVSRSIANAFTEKDLTSFPNVDGVVPVCHGTGCGMAMDGEGYRLLQRTIAGFARHPNFAGVLIVGLGCEDNNVRLLLKNTGLQMGPFLQTLTIQDLGGAARTVREGVARIREMLPEVNRVQRQSVPASELILGLECGGSDAYSGITANPALGVAADLVVGHGGTAVLSETPEIYGAEHLLTKRAVSREVGQKLVSLIEWWESYTARNAAQMDNNPSPGNKEGGLTTILEKSLGAVAKGGSTNLVDVYGYGEPVKSRGLVFMDTPGYDVVSVTGMVAGGANIICFTTGCGSVFGCKPVPTLKLASNTPMYKWMADDMDLNCGAILDAETTLEEMGKRIFDRILNTASGEKTKSEIFGFGDDEFSPWQVGVVM
jgi:altronate hydrolase